MCEKYINRKHAQEVQKGRHNMNEQAKAAGRAYLQEWKRKNPDKVKAAQERYWTKKAAEAEQAQRMEPKPQQA